MNPSPSSDTRHALRAGTREAHDRVDAHFANGLGSAAEYASYLRGMHAFVSGIDDLLARVPLSPAWRSWADTPRATWLQADLDALSLSPIDAPWSRAADGGPADGDADAAGTLYVLEGSALGARMLLGGARGLGHDDGRGASFLSRHADGEQGRRWPRFAEALGSAAFDDAASQARLLQSANAAFAHVEHCFNVATQRAARQVDGGDAAPHAFPAGTVPVPHARNPQ